MNLGNSNLERVLAITHIVLVAGLVILFLMFTSNYLSPDNFITIFGPLAGIMAGFYVLMWYVSRSVTYVAASVIWVGMFLVYIAITYKLV